jgi:antirestriction protein ArdC
MHWTGHASRLNRHALTHYGNEHALEELVAELGAAFLCSHLQVSPKLRGHYMDHAAGWLRLLRRDTGAIFQAGSLAAEACDYLRDKAREGKGSSENKYHRCAMVQMRPFPVVVAWMCLGDFSGR